jgi:hypothetical protein
LRLGLAIALALAAAGCRPELIARFATTVYPDGSLGRVLELTAEDDETEAATDEDRLAALGVGLADPEAWSDVERTRTSLRAEGFFARAADAPPWIGFDLGDERRPARNETKLEIDDRVVIRRWTYTETHGDPYSKADSALALDALVALVSDALRTEVRRNLGPEIDTAAAEEFLKSEARALAWAMLAVNRGASGWERMETREQRWSQLLRQHGLPAEETVEAGEFWKIQMPVILDWLRDRIASALSVPETPIDAGDLAFWPAGDDWEEDVTALIQRVWGSEEELTALAEPHLAAMAGFYTDADAPRFRFEGRLRMPGTLLRTNGTPDGESTIWLFRQQDLSLGDLQLRAESVEPIFRVLTDCGGRREFDRASLLRLGEILWKQDADGRLTEILRAAVKDSRLELLRDKAVVPDELQDLALELADLLDPDVPLPAAL